MFVLQNIALINWYLFSAIDIPIGGNVAIIGVNGSGKSSILDAIQTCIMGGDKTYISFNARTEQRAQERTIRDYVLGKNPHGYLRESAYNYIVLGYRRDHDGYEYSIGLAMSASGENHEIETRFAVDGRILKTSDLCNIDGENMSVVRFKELKASLDSAGIPVKTWVQASKFRTGYMADLNPSSKKTGFPGVDDDRFKRIFKHTIEFNVDKIGHISDFVRSFILPTSEMPVEDWRAQHANYKEILDRIT
ncbi:ATP-binding protein, partial [Nostoc sp. NIES-2111]